MNGSTKIKNTNHQKRAGIALMLIVLGTSLSFGDANWPVIIRTLSVFAAYFIMLPIFVGKYRESVKDWRIFIIISVLGAMALIANALFQLLEE